jgi:NAD(P)-dependent dehydrogenase (short-subunit alcohol dehydrogenase family)
MIQSKKVVVIVGAGRGIGEQLAKLFSVDSEFQVVVLTRNLSNLLEIQKKHEVELHAFDLESQNIRNDVEKMISHLPRVDYLINNAGKLVNKPFLELSKADVMTCYQTNVLGIFEVIQAILPKMTQEGGHIVNISTMGAIQGSVKFPGLSAYSSSKAALANLTEMLAEEFKNTKLKVNCLCLGTVQTEMLNEAFPGYKAPLSAVEMAGFIKDFSIHSSHFINGKILPVSLSTP